MYMRAHLIYFSHIIIFILIFFYISPVFGTFFFIIHLIYTICASSANELIIYIFSFFIDLFLILIWSYFYLALTHVQFQLYWDLGIICGCKIILFLTLSARTVICCFSVILFICLFYIFTCLQLVTKKLIIKFSIWIFNLLLSVCYLLCSLDLINLCLSWIYFCLISYLLFNFYHNHVCFIINKTKILRYAIIGDCCILINLISLLCWLHTSGLFFIIKPFWVMWYTAHYHMIYFICGSIFCLLYCKCAQFIYIYQCNKINHAFTIFTLYFYSILQIFILFYLFFNLKLLFLHQLLLCQIFYILSIILTYIILVIACYQTNINNLIVYSTVAQLSYLFAHLFLIATNASLISLCWHISISVLLLILANLLLCFFNCEHAYNQLIIKKFKLIYILFVILFLIKIIGIPYIFNIFFKSLFFVQTPISTAGLHLIFILYFCNIGLVGFFLIKLFYYLWKYCAVDLKKNLSNQTCSNYLISILNFICFNNTLSPIFNSYFWVCTYSSNWIIISWILLTCVRLLTT